MKKIKLTKVIHRQFRQIADPTRFLKNACMSLVIGALVGTLAAIIQAAF